MGPKPQRRGLQTPTKVSPDAKKLKTDSNKVRGRENCEENVNNNMETNASASPRRELLQGDLEPPLWFVQYEERLHDKLDDVARRMGEQEEKLNAMEIDLATVVSDVRKLQKENKDLVSKLDDLENRSRRNNLVIFGLKEPEGKEDCNKTVTDFLKFVGVQPVDFLMIQRCHRTPTQKQGNENEKPRMVHMAFQSYIIKEHVRKMCIQKLKDCKSVYQGRKLFVSEDLSARVRALRQNKMEVFQNLKQQGKKPYFAYPDKLRYKDQDGKIITVN